MQMHFKGQVEAGQALWDGHGVTGGGSTDTVTQGLGEVEA